MITKREIEILLVDDDPAVRTVLKRLLGKAGLEVEALASGAEALDLLRRDRRFDAIVSDLETAILAMEYGGFRYLQKRVENAHLPRVVTEAAAHHRQPLLKRKVLEICEAGGAWLGNLDELDGRFTSALDQLWIAHQPIVRWPAREVGMRIRDAIEDLRGRTRRLRDLGFRIAVDDLGAGYAAARARGHSTYSEGFRRAGILKLTTTSSPGT